MKSYEIHRKSPLKEIKISIITVSTSRYLKSKSKKNIKDISGETISNLVNKSDYEIVSKKIVDDNIEMIRLETLRSIYDENADVVIISGGTGISIRDVTIESIKPLFDKELDGFGDIFRNISFEKIGPPAHLSRSIAGIINKHLVYCLPGSPQAVETALEIILPEIPHAIYICRN